MLTLTDAGIDTTEEIPLVSLISKDGQTLFVRINDALQNTNSSAIDTVDVTIDILRGVTDSIDWNLASDADRCKSPKTL